MCTGQTDRSTDIVRAAKNILKDSPKEAYSLILTMLSLPLQSEDGVCYPCHRCVLVSRLEFFSAMFSSGWLETSTTTESRSGGKRQPKQALPMPFKADVLEVLLRFIYADDALAVRLYERVAIDGCSVSQ